MVFNEGKLKDVKLNKGEFEYSLTVTYEVTDEVGNVHCKTIHNVPLPLYTNTEQISTKVEMGIYKVPYQIDIGYGMVKCPVVCKIEDNIVKYAEKEITIEEIEKKLGYKVKIVNKKED